MKDRLFPEKKEGYFRITLRSCEILGEVGNFRSAPPISPKQVLAFSPQKYPLTQFPGRDSHWGMGNFRGISSAFRRRVDQWIDLIFARAALFAAQIEQTETD